jgi:hypothetical protein
MHTRWLFGSAILVLTVATACEVPGTGAVKGKAATSGAPSRESDSYLADEAQTAQLAIQALDVFHRERGNYPMDAAELVSVVPEADGGGDLAGGWAYSSTGGGYQLTHRLSSGSTLVYTHDGSSGSWEYTAKGGGTRPMRF